MYAEVCLCAHFTQLTDKYYVLKEWLEGRNGTGLEQRGSKSQGRELITAPVLDASELLAVKGLAANRSLIVGTRHLCG